MLKAIQLENIRRHVNTRIELGQLTVLAGTNGVGKSTALIALEAALAPIEHGPGEWQPAQLLRRGADEASVRLEVDDAPVWAAHVAPTGRGERMTFSLDGERAAWPRTREEERRVERFPRVAYLRLSAERMRSAASLTQDAALEASGANIGPVIARLTQLRDGRVEAIEKDLREIVPGLVRVFTSNRELTAGSRELAAQLEFEFEGVGRVSAEDTSAGTLLALGLLTAMRLDDVGVVLIDDAEQGLHMAAQERMMDALRAVLSVRPELQVILTTHSPFIMNKASADEIVLLGLDSATGSAVAGRINDYPDADELLRHLSPAELWTSIHEDWMTTSAGA